MSKRSLRALRTALAILLVLVLSGASALASISVKFNARTKVYKKPSTSAQYTTVSKGLQVTLTAYNGNWGRVVYRGVVGYAPMKYLDRVTPLKAYAASNTYIYKTASTATKLYSVARGTAVYVVGLEGSFTRVRNASGTKKGYMKTSTVTGKKPSTTPKPTATPKPEATNTYSEELAYKQPPASSSNYSDIPASLRSGTSSPGSSSSSRIEYTIYLAQNLIGKPYAQNANPPQSFDCARYSYYCYGKAGASLSASSYGQGYDDRFKKVLRQNLKRGDVVCFNTVSTDSDQSDHVGIYLGSGYFLHASSVAKKVIISYMGCGYYYRTFSWGRRIF